MTQVFELNLQNYKKYFVSVINAYKKNPLVMLAVSDRQTFETIGALSLVCNGHGEGTVELIMNVPESHVGEIAQQMGQWCQPFGLTVVNEQPELFSMLRDVGFEDSSNGFVIFQTSTQ